MLHAPSRVVDDEDAQAGASDEQEIVERQAPLVAVFNASEDTVDFLTVFFEQQGFRAVGQTWPARDPLTVEAAHAFLSRHQPDVVVFDVSLPYEANWQRFLDFQQAGQKESVPSVLTTTNVRALTECVGATNAIEIVGKPYDLDHLLAAVLRALATTA